MKEVTLIFPPVPHIDEKKNEKSITDFKLKAYTLWTSYIKKKFGSSSNMYKVYPSNANPISLGLLTLCTYLKKRDINVRYIHCDYWLYKKGLTWNKLVEFISSETSTSNACGFYVTTPMLISSMEIAEAVKRNNPGITIVLGGPHVTFTDIETIEQYPFVDFVVRGEGEETLYEIIANSRQKPESEILGATYRSNGTVIRAPHRPLLSPGEIPEPDFDILPKDYDLLLIDMYSRGCPFSCKFCVESIFWKNRVRYRDPQIVAGELLRIKQNFNQDVIHIGDSEIDVSPDRLKRLLDAIDREKIDCRFTVNFRPDAYKRIDAAMLNRMNDSGFAGFYIGVESGSDYMLDQMGKDATFSDFLNTIDLLNQSNKNIIIPNIMLGFPGETEETLKETQDKFITLLEEERISYLYPKIFIPYPGTDPYERPEAYSMKISKKWEEYARFGSSPPYSSSSLSNEILSASMMQFYDRILATLQRKS